MSQTINVPAGLKTFQGMSTYFTELLRPGKLITLALGIQILIIGSYTEGAPDWDVGISLIMAVVAFLTAPQAVRGLEHFVVQLFKQRAFAWKHLLASLFLVWFGADGCYYLYWSWVNPWALEMMREANNGGLTRQGIRRKFAFLPPPLPTQRRRDLACRRCLPHTRWCSFTGYRISRSLRANRPGATGVSMA